MKPMLRKSPALLAVLFGLTLALSARAEPPRVAATVIPVHSLASALMAGTDSAPELMISGRESPHHYHLRPSGAALLEEADVVFWIARGLENALADPIAVRAKPGAALELLEALDTERLIPYEEDGEHSEGHDDHEEEHGHEHGDAEHSEGHDEHGREHGHDDEEHSEGRDDHDDHDEHEEHEEHGHEEEHGHGHGHDHGDWDPHVWLSPELAGEMAKLMAAALIRADGENAELYERNLAQLHGRLERLEAELRETLSGVGAVRAFVFHDAYRYFQRSFGLRTAGTILGPEAESHGGLSAARVAELREIAEREKIHCVFTEPQFNPRALIPITRGFDDMRVLVLDPLGAEIPPGADAYFQLMRNLAKAFAECARK